FLSTFFGIIFLSSRTLDRRSYLDHGETFSIQAGIFMQYFTEYFYSDIETIERRKSIPFFSSINPFRYRYYDNPYSTKNCLDIYCIKFKEGYRIFEKGEYIAMKERHPSTWKKMRYLTISSKIFDSMHGRKIE
ncbi:MAG: hypothetical protein JW939_03390, partial [Candidatus Thermoplasmatota archaeon]|nr:hypothetical protein [Candidatus Thermoplasmatota archaeon]